MEGITLLWVCGNNKTSPYLFKLKADSIKTANQLIYKSLFKVGFRFEFK